MSGIVTPRKHFFVSLTKIVRQEIILSTEYSITFIAFSVDKLQNQESCMHKRLVHYNIITITAFQLRMVRSGHWLV